MLLRNRRILASAYILAFLIAAPLVISYGRGYRFNFKNFSFFRTGILYISGRPNTVNILIGDDESKKIQLPNSLRSLNPGQYQIKIDTTGYQNFQTDVLITPGQVTTIQNLQLFREQPFSLVQTAIGPKARLAPNGGAVAWVDGNQISIALPKQKLKTSAISQLKTITWDPTGSKIIALDEKKSPIAIIDRAAHITIISKPPFIAPLAATSGALVIIKKDDQFAVWQGNSWTPFSIPNVQNPAAIGKSIFFIETIGNALFLFRTSSQGNTEAQIALPKLQTPSLRQSNTHIWISDTQAKKTYLITDENLKQPLRQLDFETTNIESIPESQDLLLTNQNAAWLLDNKGNVSNASRWITPIIRAVDLGQHSLLLVRTNELFLRDLIYEQTQQKSLPGIVDASMTDTSGTVDFIIKDGDLLQWMRGTFF